jgi:hypothetical protein
LTRAFTYFKLLIFDEGKVRPGKLERGTNDDLGQDYIFKGSRLTKALMSESLSEAIRHSQVISDAGLTGSTVPVVLRDFFPLYGPFQLYTVIIRNYGLTFSMFIVCVSEAFVECVSSLSREVA